MLEIVNPANGEKIQIADSDLVNHLNWQMAVNECKNLGNGWRLPTIDEIKLIPYNEMGKNVLYNSYWTSSETEKNEFNISPNALKYNFGREMQFNASKDELHLVRPIRTIQIVNQNNTSISNPTQNLKTVKAQSENETKSSMKNAIDSIPTTNFLEDLITGENLTNTRSFLLYLSSCIILFFGGRYIFETTNIKGDGNDLLAIIIHLILIIISIIMMLASPILLIVSLNYSSSISELFYYNRNKRIAQEEVVMNEKKSMEYAIQIKERTENFKLKIAKIEQLRKVNWDNLTTSEKEQALIIKNPITGDKLRVASKNFSKMMDYQQAMIECRALGNGWRLPTIEELKEMDLHLYQKGLGDFITYDNIQKVHYHSAYSNYNYDNSSIQYSFFLGQTLSSGYRNAWVRVVKSI